MLMRWLGFKSETLEIEHEKGEEIKVHMVFKTNHSCD